MASWVTVQLPVLGAGRRCTWRSFRERKASPRITRPPRCASTTLCSIMSRGTTACMTRILPLRRESPSSRSWQWGKRFDIVGGHLAVANIERSTRHAALRVSLRRDQSTHLIRQHPNEAAPPRPSAHAALTTFRRSHGNLTDPIFRVVDRIAVLDKPDLSIAPAIEVIQWRPLISEVPGGRLAA